jgi:hypothetical protein
MQLFFLLATLASPQDTDATRAALYRIDAEARLARLHPDDCAAHAQSAQRQAHELAAKLEPDPALARQAIRLANDTDALADAARGPTEAGLVVDRAEKVELGVRLIDTMLPAPPRAK